MPLQLAVSGAATAGLKPVWRRRWWLLAALLSALSLLPVLHADQYRSEAREAQPVPGTPRSAQEMLQRATDPYARAMLLRDLAEQAARAGDYGKARRFLSQALAQHALSAPAQAQMRKNLAVLSAAGGDPHAVIAALAPEYAKNPHLPPQQQVALGAAYAQLQRWDQAVPLLEHGVAAEPDPPPAWLRTLAAAELGAKRYPQAAAALSRLLRRQPDRRELWLQLAQAQLKAGANSDAQVTLELAQRLGFLDSPALRLQLVQLMADNGQPYPAAVLLGHFLDSHQVEDSLSTQRLLAALWQRARERRLAIAAFSGLRERSPSPQLDLTLGELYLQVADYARAADALQRALAHGVGGGLGWMNLALARYQVGDVDGALAAFTQAAKAKSSRTLAEHWITYLQSDAARRLALQAAASRPAPAVATSVPAPPDLFAQAPVELGGEGEGSGSVAASASTALTPVGAQAAGNADGTIPPWRGGLIRARWPKGFHPGERLVNPYADEKPLFTITAQNYRRYAAHLAPAYLALFAKYPDYVMHVYPTHRSVWYPKAIYAATQANLGRAKLLGSDALSGAHLGFPFPQPESGVQAMWNHRVRYRGDSAKMESMQAVVSPNGDEHRLRQMELVYARYANLRDPVDIDRDNILLYYLTVFSKPDGGFDFLALVHETANSLKKPRAIWVMPPGLPKMFRIPPVGYDQPFPGSDGLYFIDMVDMYNGAFDRYVWKLVGKRELYIPYNDFDLSSGRYRYRQLLTPRHFNQTPVRYELHRVWVVEATTRPGTEHAFGKRVFYLDEDSWNVVLVENYDHRGRLWRFQEGHLLPLYDIGAANCIPVVTYDLRDGRYFATRLIGQEPPIEYHLPGMSDDAFSPGAVRARYAR